MSKDKGTLRGLLERLTSRFGRFSGTGKNSSRDRVRSDDPDFPSFGDEEGIIFLGGDGEQLPDELKSALGRMLSLSSAFPEPKVFDKGYVLEGMGIPCPSMKPHDHIALRLNETFADPKTPSEDDPRVKIFTDRDQIQGYLDDIMRNGEIDQLADLRPDGMTAPGMMQMTASIPMMQLSDGRIMLVKDKRHRVAIEDEMAGTPNLHAMAPHGADSEDVFRWIDRVTVVLAAKDGLNGQKLISTDGASVSFVDGEKGYDFSSWRHLIETAVDVQQFAEIAVEAEPNQPVSLDKAVSATKGLIGVGFGLGTAVVEYDQTDDEKTIATIKHPVLWDFEVKITAADHEDGPATFSVNYKNAEGRQIQFEDIELTNTSFSQKIFQPMAEQYKRDFEELYRVDHLLEISRLTSPGQSLGSNPLMTLTGSGPEDGAEAHYRA